MLFGIRAAKYPIIEEDPHPSQLPERGSHPIATACTACRSTHMWIASIREERRPASRYASIEQCRAQVRKVESLFKTFQIPFINSTNTSLEEISTEGRSNNRPRPPQRLITSSPNGAGVSRL